MMNKKQSKLFSFRVPAELAGEIDEAARRSGKDKSAWILGAVLEKLGKPDASRSPESRMEALISQMEGLLSGPAALPAQLAEPGAIKATSATALAAKEIIRQMASEAERLGIQSSNKAIINRLNELGIKPARGGIWTTSTVDGIKRRMKRIHI
ncbi:MULTISPECIES: ribbon-helix-helix protein, CopG family [Yersinia]|uniref:Ribbon-helix-helix protein CopG domain-containing protein n=1 Tax=Yersinia intermedia TaxID=631 RepID=A0A0T9MHE7_YERIN|nr:MULTISPECIES: ribbon-helix-helix protein, CopG family [Yersinia]UYJ97981.1 ribbon-helix-helix protein, CopG family [Yersinia enterocolitica]CNG10325.1 Uncharacterised protein [Yersinia intermedia]